MDQDTQILKLLERGRHEEAFHGIIDHYQERLYWHIRRMVQDHDDAQDVLQNCMIKVWKALPKFRAQSKVYTWLYRIASNESITFLNKKREDSSFDDVAHQMAQNLSTDHYFDGDEIQLRLFQAMASLPDKQKAVFAMKYFDEMKYEEMSEVLNTSVGALKASYHHAVKKIEKYLNAD